MKAPMPYRAEQGYLDQEESKDQTLEPDRANANDNGSSTPPAPKPYQAPAQEGVSEARPVTQAPTFSQMQAAGEARPPMPSSPMAVSTAGGPMGQVAPGGFRAPESAPDPSAGPTAPMSTLSGDWQAPTASAGSSPLIATVAGGTMTPEGDAANQFRGYQTDQGGGFGGYDTAPLANDPQGRTFKTYDQDFVKNANALKQVPPLSQAEFQAMRATDDGANLVKDKIARGEPVTDKELAYVRQARGMELQQDTASPTFGTFGTKAGGTTAADPAEQERLLAGQADGTVPKGPQAYTPPTLPMDENTAGGPQGQVALGSNTPPASGGVVPAGPGAIITTQTGGQNTGPSSPSTQGQSNTNSAADILGLLTKGATDPGRYGTEQVKNSYNWLGGNIDDEYALRERQLKEDMSRRGLSDSTINAGNLKDLNIGRRSAKESLAYDLGDKVASTGAQDKASTLDYLRGLMGYGQQGFENDMTTAKFNADQENNWNDFLMKMLGAGYGTAGA